MDATFQYRIEKKEFIRGLRTNGALIALQYPRTRVLILFGFIAALALVEWRIPRSLPWMLLGISLLYVVLVILCRLQYHAIFDPAAVDREVTFDGKGIVERDGNQEHSWTWGALRRVEELPDIVLLQFLGWHWVPLPNRLWKEPGDRSQFIRKLRDQAPNILPPRTWKFAGGSGFLTAGAIAAGLNVALLARGVVYLFVDMCDCAVRRSPLGQTISVVTVIGALIAIPWTKIGLERLKTNWPRISSAITAALILPPAVLGVWIALRFLRFV